ncbi:MAG: hypothetical protein LBS00_09860 [Synergistaceae bacterium]|nr:hypothetical protein [Synergistaceae bacterium]
MRSGAQVVFGMDQMFVSDAFTEVWILGGVRVMAMQMFMIVLLCILSVCIWFFLKKTRTGMQLKAVSMDKKTAALVGVDVRRIMILGNSLGCALGGVSGWPSRPPAGATSSRSISDKTSCAARLYTSPEAPISAANLMP